MADIFTEAMINRLRGAGEFGMGVGETALTLGSGMVGGALGGLHGISDLARGRGVEKAAKSARETSEDFTYAPRGDVAQRGLQNIGESIEKVTQPIMEHAVDPIGEKSPLLGAALLTAGNAIGPKGAKVKGGNMAQILRERKAPGIPVSSESGPILPRMSDTRIPAEQELIPRLTPMGREPGYNERSVALLRSPKAARMVDELIGKGRAINPELENWYGSEPLRQFALNEGLSEKDFNRMMAHFSSASQRSPVLKENLAGSHMWGLDRQGLLPSDKPLWTNKLRVGRDDPGVIALPEGMGSLAQSKIFGRAQRLAAGEDPSGVFGEKLHSYYQNKLGNEMPVTVDVNAVKGPVISARNPDFLKTLYTVKDSQGNIVTQSKPLRDYERGKLKMGEAVKTPGLFIDAPHGAGEYKAFEELWRRGADRAGVSPAGAQALGWYGSADVTALATPPKTYMELIEQSARKAADRQGITPTEAMRRAVRGSPGGQLGNARLGLVGALAAGGTAAGGLAYALRDRKKKDEPPKEEKKDENADTTNRRKQIDKAVEEATQ